MRNFKTSSNIFLRHVIVCWSLALTPGVVGASEEAGSEVSEETADSGAGLSDQDRAELRGLGTELQQRRLRQLGNMIQRDPELTDRMREQLRSYVITGLKPDSPDQKELAAFERFAHDDWKMMPDLLEELAQSASSDVVREYLREHARQVASSTEERVSGIPHVFPLQAAPPPAADEETVEISATDGEAALDGVPTGGETTELPRASAGSGTEDRPLGDVSEITRRRESAPRRNPVIASLDRMLAMAPAGGSSGGPASDADMVSSDASPRSHEAESPVSTTSDSDTPSEEDLDYIRDQLWTNAIDWAVTDTNAWNAHATFKGMSSRAFNRALQTLAGEQNGYYINTYLLEADEADAAYTAEFAGWLSRDMDRTTASRLIQVTSPAAWGVLMKAIATLPPAERRAVVERFGGADRVAAKTLYERLRAEHQGLRDATDGMSRGMQALDSAVSFGPSLPGNLMDLLTRQGTSVLGVYATAVSAAPGAVMGAIQTAVTSPGSTAADYHFVGLLEGLGMTGHRPHQLLGLLKQMYNE